MKIDTAKGFKRLDGNDVEENGVPLKLGKACSQVLASSLEGDQRQGADKVLARWKLAQALYSAEGDFELSPEQATEIRARAPQVFQLVVAGQLIEALS